MTEPSPKTRRPPRLLARLLVSLPASPPKVPGPVHDDLTRDEQNNNSDVEHLCMHAPPSPPIQLPLLSRRSDTSFETDAAKVPVPRFARGCDARDHQRYRLCRA